jgi:hypothetical protein
MLHLSLTFSGILVDAFIFFNFFELELLSFYYGKHIIHTQRRLAIICFLLANYNSLFQLFHKEACIIMVICVGFQIKGRGWSRV